MTIQDKRFKGLKINGISPKAKIEKVKKPVHLDRIILIGACAVLALAIPASLYFYFQGRKYEEKNSSLKNKIEQDSVHYNSKILNLEQENSRLVKEIQELENKDSLYESTLEKLQKENKFLKNENNYLRIDTIK